MITIPKVGKFRKFTLKNKIYQYYIERLSGSLPYNKYRDLCQEFNAIVFDRMIQHGELFNMGHGLSVIGVVTVARNFDKLVIDWPSSNKKKKRLIEEGKTPRSKENPKGENWLVYLTDTFFTRFWWDLYNCKVSNKGLYEFAATRGECGNNAQLVRHLREDDIAYTKYMHLEKTHGKYTYKRRYSNNKDLQGS